MTRTGNLRFGWIASLIAVAALAAVSPLVYHNWPDAIAWMFGAWLLLALVGIGDGIWLLRKYGRADSGFLAALVVGILTRMVVVGAGCFLAFRAGGGAAWGFLAGTAAGFLPLQVLEVIWFMRLTKRHSPEIR